MRTRPLPPLDDLHAALAEAGVTDTPREGDEKALRGLLDLALYLAENRKRVSFEGFTWDDPGFTAADAKVRMRVAYARARDAAVVEDVVRANLARVAQGSAILALDAHDAEGLREYDLMHRLYGRVTLFAWPHKPSESADPRIDAAREAGWTKTLKEHNLLPGRGIVVLDEHQGLILRDEQFTTSLLGMLILYPDGHVQLTWNPFVAPERATSEIQYWLAWGEGHGASSEWRRVLHVEEGE